MDNQKLTYYIPSEPDYYSPDCTDRNRMDNPMVCVIENDINENLYKWLK